MASKRDQFLTACRNAKLDTVRWGLGAGGQNPGTRDDDGHTAIMLAVLGNKHKAVQMLLDNCRRSRMKEPMDFVDGQGDEKTALMMAAERGYAESCEELLYAGANYKMKCAKGHTAADYARKGGFDALARRIDRGGDSSEEEEDDEEEMEEEEGFEGETSTQRSKRKKKEMEALERRGEKSAPGKGVTKSDQAHEAKKAAEKAPEARWPETVKAKESDAKEVSIEREKGDTEVDPALFFVSSINNLKLNLGKSFTQLSPDISRLSGLLTLIISGNGLTSLPESIGKLKHLKTLEAEHNKLTSLPASLADCSSLEILRVGHNQITTLAPLEEANNLVTLAVDHNKLTTLDDFGIEAKERLVSLSASYNKITDAPDTISQCTLLAEIHLRANRIEELPGEWGELKEKKVRVIELEENPLKDPKVKKMMGKSATFVKELLTYLRKNGKKNAGKKKSKPAKAVSESEESDDDEPAPAPAPAPSKSKPAAKAAVSEDEQSETEEELEERMAKMNKKEREKFKRKLAEERLAKAAKEAESKRKAADAAAAARMQAAKTMQSDDDDDDGDESDIDSDDELALLARKKKKAGKGGGFLYAMTDEQRADAEKAEAERLLKIELAKQAEEDAKKEAEERAALELAARVSGVKLTGDGVYGWEYTGGQFKSTRVPALPKGAKGPCVELEIPKIIVGKLIGAKGATIKGVQDRSKAMVSIDETKGGSGNSLLRVRGDEPSMESARMLMNNALAGKR